MHAPRRRTTAIVVGLTCCALVSGCGSSPSLLAAKRGDLAALRASVARERALCRLDRAEVRSLARATADRELTHAGPTDALVRIDEARACSHALSDSLERLADRSDDVGASATLALLEGTTGDKDGERRLRRYRSSPQALWRAVAARASVGEELGTSRRGFYADPDERVRLAALRAALENADHADAGPLLEVARLDPNPLARALSARALGAIANGDVVLALRDLYWRADEGVRQSIVDAWGQREAAAAGGIRELVRVVDTETGAPAIEAGWVLSRVARDGDAGAVGNAAILRGIADGAARNRVLAILRAPMDDTRATNALRKAADSPDPSVATAALSRLADVRATRDDALRRLEALSRTGAREALHALARTGNGWAIREVARELSAGSAETRLAAARTLVVAGELERAADLLSDADPHVRMTAACAILNSRED